MKYLIILLFTVASFGGYSTNHKILAPDNQLSVADSIVIWEKLNIQCDSKINDLLRQQADQGKRSGTINGYRLQIYFGSGANSHNQAVKMKTDFLSSYPDVKTYLLFKSPDFILRVGNFRTKSEALKMQKSLLYKFPNAFIVADEIAIPEFINFTTIN